MPEGKRFRFVHLPQLDAPLGRGPNVYETVVLRIWWFPKMGVPPNHPNLNGIFP